MDKHELGELRSGILDTNESPHDFAVRKLILELVESTGTCKRICQMLSCAVESRILTGRDELQLVASADGDESVESIIGVACDEADISAILSNWSCIARHLPSSPTAPHCCRRHSCTAR